MHTCFFSLFMAEFKIRWKQGLSTPKQETTAQQQQEAHSQVYRAVQCGTSYNDFPDAVCLKVASFTHLLED